MADRLYSEFTATAGLTGARDRIVFYHGLYEGRQPVAPDFVDLEFIRSNESGGVGGAAADHWMPFANVAVAGETVTVGSAGFTELWTFADARTTPYTVTRGATAAASVTNLVAAFNLDTSQNLVADAVVAGTFRVRSAVIPGGNVENGVRDLSGELSTTGDAWNTTSNGAGNVAGAPSWSVLAKDARKVVFRVRGLQIADTLLYRARAFRLHSSIRSPVTQLATGTNGSVAAGGVTFTSAGANFQTSGVRLGDLLCIIEPDGTVANIRNNGAYRIAAAGTTTLTVDAAVPFKVTQANLDYTVGNAAVLLGTEYAAGGGSIEQVPFDLPAGTAHSAATEATDAELPGPAIETGEIAAGALSADAPGRAIMADGYFDAATALAKLGADSLTNTVLLDAVQDGAFVADANTRALFADSFLPPVKMTIDPVADVAEMSKAYIYFTGNTADAQTVSIGAMIFEFDDGGGVVPGNIAVAPGGAGPWAAAASAVALVAAINAEPTCTAESVIGADGVAALLAGKDVYTAITLGTTCPNGVVSAAAFQVGADGADQYGASGIYTVTADDVAKWLLGATHEVLVGAAEDVAGIVPLLADFRICVVAAGVRTFRSPATIGYRIVQINTNSYALLVRDGGAVMAANDEIQWTLRG